MAKNNQVGDFSDTYMDNVSKIYKQKGKGVLWLLLFIFNILFFSALFLPVVWYPFFWLEGVITFFVGYMGALFFHFIFGVVTVEKVWKRRWKSKDWKFVWWHWMIFFIGLCMVFYVTYVFGDFDSIAHGEYDEDYIISLYPTYGEDYSDIPAIIRTADFASIASFDVENGISGASASDIINKEFDDFILVYEQAIEYWDVGGWFDSHPDEIIQGGPEFSYWRQLDWFLTNYGVLAPMLFFIFLGTVSVWVALILAIVVTIIGLLLIIYGAFRNMRSLNKQQVKDIMLVVEDEALKNNGLVTPAIVASAIEQSLETDRKQPGLAPVVDEYYKNVSKITEEILAKKMEINDIGLGQEPYESVPASNSNAGALTTSGSESRKEINVYNEYNSYNGGPYQLAGQKVVENGQTVSANANQNSSTSRYEEHITTSNSSNQVQASQGYNEQQNPDYVPIQQYAIDDQYIAENMPPGMTAAQQKRWIDRQRLDAEQLARQEELRRRIYQRRGISSAKFQRGEAPYGYEGNAEAIHAQKQRQELERLYALRDEHLVQSKIAREYVEARQKRSGQTSEDEQPIYPSNYEERLKNYERKLNLKGSTPEERGQSLIEKIDISVADYVKGDAKDSEIENTLLHIEEQKQNASLDEFEKTILTEFEKSRRREEYIVKQIEDLKTSQFDPTRENLIDLKELTKQVEKELTKDQKLAAKEATRQATRQTTNELNHQSRNRYSMFEALEVMDRADAKKRNTLEEKIHEIENDLIKSEISPAPTKTTKTSSVKETKTTTAKPKVSETKTKTVEESAKSAEPKVKTSETKYASIETKSVAKKSRAQANSTSEQISIAEFEDLTDSRKFRNNDPNSIIVDKTIEVAKSKTVEHYAKEENKRIKAYKLPPIDIFTKSSHNHRAELQVRLKADVERKVVELNEFFVTFKIKAEVSRYEIGSRLINFDVEIKPGQTVKRITQLEDDIKRTLSAETIRILAPVPGTNILGIEIPHNNEETILYRDIWSKVNPRTNKGITIPLGENVKGQAVSIDIQSAPHILIAGQTGSGKSVMTNVILASILMCYKPQELKLVLIDPKMVEFNDYQDIPHLYAPVVTDVKHASAVLKKLVEEMDERYQMLRDRGAKHIDQYNDEIEGTEKYAKMPYIVCVIDELADLMLVAPKDVEESIQRLTQKARAAGIYLIVATQKPTTDVITGVIKANIPTRIAFAVASQYDSRTILDTKGAESLVGKGDMLVAPTGKLPYRAQCAFLTHAEIKSLTKFCADQASPNFNIEISTIADSNNDYSASSRISKTDMQYLEARAIVIELGKASTSLLQRRMRIGYNKAADLIDALEEYGVIGPRDGVKQRDVLVSE